jgi:nucleoside-diphosphate-sugar epimerase
VRRQSEAATALWFGVPPSGGLQDKKMGRLKAELQTIQSGVALRLPPHSKWLSPFGQRTMNERSNQTFLITGAHGFIGAWIIKRLLATGARIVIFDQSAEQQRLRLIMSDEEISRTTVVTGDITEADALLPIIDNFAVSNIIHLAGLQVPTCRANPRLGAMVNVVGTINVFEAARQRRDQISNVTYASSAAVFGVMDGNRAITERDELEPTSHYGVFKRCNEGNARIYHLDHGVHSIGLRPLTVYGVGRDFGVTSDPTKAMKAAVLGRPFHIRFGGRTDFQYVADTADVFIRAATSNLPGAHVFNLHGETIPIAEVVAEIERAWPRAAGTITYADAPLPIPAEMDDHAIRAALGSLPATPLAEGVRRTMARFAELQSEGRLDTSDLDV